MLIHLLATLHLIALCASTDSNVIPDWVTHRWAQNSVGLLAGPATSSGEIWSMLTDSCDETYGNSTVDGTNCMSDAIYTLLYIATSRNGALSDAADIKNGTLAGKRSPSVEEDSGLTLRSISRGSNIVPGSTVSVYSSRSTRFEHVSNGTHGSVRTMTTPYKSDRPYQAKLRHRRNTFSYGEEVKGLKLSYSTSCTFAQFNDDSLASLRFLAYNLANLASDNMQADKYALEVYDPVDHTINHMLATLIAEVDGYGNDYEDFPFASAYPFATDC